ncbi:MAG: glycosyltransferase [bacterium]
MKILFLAQFPLFGNGSGNYTRRLAKYLNKKGHEIAIAAPDDRSFDFCKVYKIKPAISAVFESNPELKGSPKYREINSKQFSDIYLSYLIQIVDIVEDFRPDVVHVNHCFFLTWIANYIKYIYGIGYIVTAHGTGIMQSTLDRRYLILTEQALARASAIIAVSNHTMKWMLKVFGAGLRRRTRIMPGGIDLESLTKIDKLSNGKFHKKYGLDNNKIVLFVGRLTKEKGVEYLIKAAKNLKNTVVCIIGDGNYREFLEGIVKTEKIKNVKFLGYFGKDKIKDIHKFYYNADVLVLPSVVDESLGLVTLEAMAYGTPVVASNKGGIPLAVKDNWNGFLVRAKSSKAIAIAVNKILNNEELEKKFSDNALKIVRDRFNWRSMIPELEKLYYRVKENTEKLQKHRKIAYLSPGEIKRERKELEKKFGLQF